MKNGLSSSRNLVHKNREGDGSKKIDIRLKKAYKLNSNPRTKKMMRFKKINKKKGGKKEK